MVFCANGLLCLWYFSDAQTIVLVHFRAPKTCKVESNRVTVKQVFTFSYIGYVHFLHQHYAIRTESELGCFVIREVNYFSVTDLL
jgi:hypothetical protein